MATVVDMSSEYERTEPWQPNVVFLMSADNSRVEAALTERLIRNVNLNATLPVSFRFGYIILGILEATGLSLGEIVGYTEAVFGRSAEPGNTNYIESAFVEGNLALLSSEYLPLLQIDLSVTCS